MLDKLIEILDEYVAAHGYGRLGLTVVTFLSFAGLLSSLLGTTWLRMVSVTILAVAAVLVLLLGIAERRRLYSRIERDAGLINKYVRIIQHEKPFKFKQWRQFVEIAPNGDCRIRIQVTMSPADGHEPHFVILNSIYYGSMTLTDRAKRRVRYDSYFRNKGGASRDTRANSTYSWTLSHEGKPRHNVVVHLGGKVEDGDIVTVEWRWPRFSADLRALRSSELFDVFFTTEVLDYRYEIRIKDARGVQPAITRRGVRTFTQKWDDDDYVIVFSGRRPATWSNLGVEVDMKPRAKK